MPYSLVVDSFHTKKLFTAFFKRSAILDGNRPFWGFETLGDLGATYDDHLGLVGKRVGTFY